MKFSDIVRRVEGVRKVCGPDPEVREIVYDSRQVTDGCVFVAWKGASRDGHDFIGQAVEAGAAAVVGERESCSPDVLGEAAYAVAADARRAMGPMAAEIFAHPSRNLKLAGVTGTSGKTTVTYLIQAVCEAEHSGSAGLIGTLGARIGGELLPTAHTTPESADVQRLLAQMSARGAKAVAMEVSSHGLHQGRTLGCEFDCGVFTNIARDHLDYHKTLEAYLDAKLILFRDHPAASGKKFTAVVNADDEAAPVVKAVCAGELITFGVDKPADVRASKIVVTNKSVEFVLSYGRVRRPARLGIGGHFNVYNALSAAAVGIAFGIDLDTIVAGLASAKCVPGRFEYVEGEQDFGVVVDYAHTPDELENVLSTARKLTQGRLIAVFGCGGDRDRGKRPVMGKIASDIADLVVVTSDNPRTENPDSIIEEILTGMSKVNEDEATLVRPDRRDAIGLAIGMARAGDLVVIAGKGHEDYQIFADRTIHFDDREVAAQILAEPRCSATRQDMSFRPQGDPEASSGPRDSSRRSE